MIVLVTAPFVPPRQIDSRSAGWRRFIQSLGRRLRALAAERRRRRISSLIHNFDPATSTFHHA
jgi:hypothetical protein